MAIARFVARKAGLQGDNDADFAKSEMLLEESVDIANLVGKAYYAADRKAEMDKTFDEVIPQHLAALEKLATGKFFSLDHEAVKLLWVWIGFVFLF